MNINDINMIQQNTITKKVTKTEHEAVFSILERQHSHYNTYRINYRILKEVIEGLQVVTEKRKSLNAKARNLRNGEMQVPEREEEEEDQNNDRGSRSSYERALKQNLAFVRYFCFSFRFLSFERKINKKKKKNEK